MSDYFCRYVKASYTVEAAFLIPFGFALVLLFISMSLIFYDNTAGAAWTYENMIRVYYEKETEEPDTGDIAAAVTAFTGDCSVDNLKVTISLKGINGFLTVFEKNMTGVTEPGFSMELNETEIYGEQIVRLKRFSGEGEE